MERFPRTFAAGVRFSCRRSTRSLERQVGEAREPIAGGIVRFDLGWSPPPGPDGRPRRLDTSGRAGIGAAISF